MYIIFVCNPPTPNKKIQNIKQLCFYSNRLLRLAQGLVAFWAFKKEP